MAIPQAHVGRLANRVAIVTGASEGIGRAIALAFSLDGAAVVCADIKESSGSQTHDLITKAGAKAMFVKTDVGDGASMENLTETAVRQYGRLDIIVNNAGIALEASNPRPIYETPEEVYDSTMRINSKGVWLGCKFAGAQMMKQDILPGSTSRGWIINISSVLGLTGKGGTSSYAASKGSVIGLTRAVAMDYAPFNIHCNAICPGFTQTAMIQAMSTDTEIRKGLDSLHPLKGLGTVEDIAKAALFLASDDCSWITAVSLPVDGGYVAA